MRYVNLKTKFSVELGSLAGSERTFYEKAVRQFRQNVDWFSFEDFLFSPGSPIYAQRRSHLEVLRDPVYLALKDMWLQLGVQQGMIARRKEVGPAHRRRVTSVTPSSSRRDARPAELLIATGVAP